MGWFRKRWSTVPRAEKDKLTTTFVRDHGDLVNARFPHLPLRKILGRLDDIIEDFLRQAIKLSPTHEAVFSRDIMGAAIHDVAQAQADQLDWQVCLTLGSVLIREWYPQTFPVGLDLDGADGTRWSMRTSYAQNVASAPPELVRSIGSAHLAGLFGALGSRYVTLGVSYAEIDDRAATLWLELMPFLHLPEDSGAEALAEYIVWKEIETRHDARRVWLTRTILDGLRCARDAGKGEVVDRLLGTPPEKSDVFPWLVLIR